MDSAGESFEAIRAALADRNNILTVKDLCELAGVSRSGYYNWVCSEKNREFREAKDRAAFEQILEAYRFRGYAKGVRGIHMRLLHKESHTRAHTAKHGAFRTGVVSLPSERSARLRTSPGWVSEPALLCRFGILAGRCSRRTQKAFGTAMRLCASLSRGVAAPLGCVIFLQFGDVAVFSLCAQYFLDVRGGGGITTLGAFHTVRKPCVAVA